MDGFARDLGYLVLGTPVLFGMLWGVAHSPLLQWALKMLYLVAWGALSFVLPLCFAALDYFPRGQWVAGGLCLVLTVFLGGLWVIVGVPELWRSLKTPTLRLWE